MPKCGMTTFMVHKFTCGTAMADYKLIIFFS